MSPKTHLQGIITSFNLLFLLLSLGGALLWIKGKKAGFNTFYFFNEVNTDLGPVTDPAWPVSTGGAAIQAHCVLVERSKQWNTSFNQPNLSKD